MSFLFLRRTCVRCRQQKPVAGSVQQPGKKKFICAECAAKKKAPAPTA